MRKPQKEIQLTSYNELLGIDDSVNPGTDRIVEIPISDLHPFKGHPFKVLDDEKMTETAESIRNYGVLNPGLVRPRAEGGYEVVAGHRRKRGCELAGKDTMPVLIRNYSDDEAVIIMVDSNIQRENILPSEKAFAYKMKLEAMKHQGAKGTGDTADLVGKEAGAAIRKRQSTEAGGTVCLHAERHAETAADCGLPGHVVQSACVGCVSGDSDFSNCLCNMPVVSGDHSISACQPAISGIENYGGTGAGMGEKSIY